MIQVYMHRYFGCLCTDDSTKGETIYGFMTDNHEFGGHGLALIQEMLHERPDIWECLGEL